MKKLIERITHPHRPTKKTEDKGFPAVSMGVHISAPKNQPIYTVLRAAIAAAGIFGTVISFTTAMENRGISCFDGRSAVIAAAAGWLWFSLLFGLGESRPEFSKNAASLSVIALLMFGIANVRKIASGFMAAANIILGDIYPKYHDSPLFDPDLAIADIIEKNGAVTSGDFIDLALCFIILLMSAAACRGSVAKPFLILFFGATFPLAEICLYFGLVPDYRAFALLAASWCAALAAEITQTGIFADKGAGGLFSKTSSQSGIAAFLAMLLCFGGAALYGSGHVRSAAADNFRTAFSVYMRSFSWEKFTEDLADFFLPAEDSGVTHDGKLGNVDSVEFGGDAMLYVSLPKNADTLYLKGFTACEYQGSRWLKGEELPILESKLTSQEFFAARIMKNTPPFEGLNTQSVVVRNVGMSTSVRYYPSNAAGLLETDGKRRRYGVYFPDGNWRKEVMDSAEYLTLTGETKRDEAAMRAYAYAYCLDVPETFTASEEFFQGYNGVTLYEELNYIRAELSKRCSYDLTSGKKPFGADFAQWFLTENKKGSCTHFATAAVLLCRSRGIPARYCEGYIVKAEDLEQAVDSADKSADTSAITVCVPDSRAHAWAEIYVDNIGWISFEATPGYGNIAYTAYPGSGESEETSVITQVETEPPVYGSEDMTLTATTAVNPENAEGDMTEVTVTEPVETETAESSVINPEWEGEGEGEQSETEENLSENPGESTDTQTGGESGGEAAAEDEPGSNGGSTEGGESTGNDIPGEGSAGSPQQGSPEQGSPEQGSPEQGDPSPGDPDSGDPNGAAPGMSGVPDTSDIPGGQNTPDNPDESNPESGNEQDSSRENPDSGEALRQKAAAVGKVLLTILTPIAAAGLIALSFIGRRRLILRRRKRLRENAPERAAAEIYLLLTKAAKARSISLESLNSIPSDERGEYLEKNGMPKGCAAIVSAALKARFGGGITPEELATAERAYNEIMTEIIQTKRDRLVHKYIKCSDRY